MEVKINEQKTDNQYKFTPKGVGVPHKILCGGESDSSLP